MSVPWTCAACGSEYYGSFGEEPPHLCDCGRDAVEKTKALGLAAVEVLALRGEVATLKGMIRELLVTHETGEWMSSERRHEIREAARDRSTPRDGEPS